MSEHLFDFSNLSGQCTVITGGGGVLANAFAKALLGVGCRSALLDLNSESAEQAAAQLREETGGECIGIGCDVLSHASLVEAKQRIEQSFGPVDILINAAGGNSPKATTECEQIFPTEQTPGQTSFFDLPMDAFDQALRLNLTGTVLPSQVFGQAMVQCKSGVILNISSMNAFKPLTRIPAYSAAKCAVSNFTEWLAVHLGPTGVRVNAIAPGFFLTEQLKYLAFDSEGNLTPRYKKVLSKVAMHRLGKPEELQGAVLFLCSDLSQYITGVTLPIDGGFNASSGV